MDDPYEILERLEAHILVALNADGPITKSSAYYRYRLGQLSELQRSQIRDECEGRGLTAEFGTGMGGMCLTLAARKR